MQLSDNDSVKIKQFYQTLLTKYGHNDPKSYGWNTIYTQEIRFMILSEIADLEGATILDVGCGTGDFYQYLRKRLKKFTYLGVDIVTEMINSARCRFPESDFRVLDVSQGIDQKFDYVFSSGLLSIKVENYKQVYFGMIRNMFEACKKGVAFNFLNLGESITDDTYISYDPLEINKYCYKLTKNISNRHDYLDYDWTVYLYK
jgi:ubiquinone/menaquinone biosynthesis C-methylase UbiE